MHNTVHVRCQGTAALVAGIVLALTPASTAAQTDLQLDAQRVQTTQPAAHTGQQVAQFAWHARHTAQLAALTSRVAASVTCGTAYTPQLTQEAMPLTASQLVLAAAQMLNDGPTSVPGVRIRPSIGRNGPTASISWTARRVTGVTVESELATTVRAGLVIADGRGPVWSLRINLARSQRRAIPNSGTRRSFA